MRKVYYKKILFFILFTFLIYNAFSQNKGKISGQIQTSDKQPAVFVTVALVEIGKISQTSEEGIFTFTGIAPGTYTLKSSYIGLKSQEIQVLVEPGQTTKVELTLVENAAELSEVVVSATRSQNRRPVSVGKTNIQPMDLPQSISIVNREIIEDQQASKLSDVIKNVNGVSLGTTRGTSVETFFARGYNLGSNNIMRNGARVNTGVIPEASSLEKVEVLKGSSALLYGMVSGGAVINMVTKQPKFNYGEEISMRMGSYDLYKPMVDFYGPISKKLAFRVVGNYEKARSYRSTVESEKFYINPSLLYKLGEKTEILVQADYLKNDFTPDFGIGSADGKIPVNIARNKFFNTPWAYQKVEQTSATATINHKINEIWKLNALASYSNFKRNYFSTERIQANAEGDWGRNLTRALTSEDYYSGQLNLNGTFKTGGITHQMLAGADAERYMNISHTFKLSAAYDTINIYNSNKYTPRTDIPETPAISRTETPTNRFGIYAQDLISVSKKLKVLAGLRWSFQQVAEAKVYDLVKNTETKSSTASTKIDRALSPRIGIVYQPLKNTSTFGSYSNNFVPNTGKGVNEQNLKPSIIDQFELGVKNEIIRGRLSANITYYKIINNDLAIQAMFEKDGITVNTNSAVKEFSGETTSDGLEIDLTGSPISGLNFMAGYSYNFMRYTKTKGGTGSYYEGERLVSNPAHTANGTIFYTLQTTKLKGLKMGVSGFYTGKRYGGWNNTVGQTQKFSRLIPVGSFTTFDVSLGYSFSKISLIAKLSNITNELNYYVHENYSVNPIPPRQFVTTISFRF